MKGPSLKSVSTGLPALDRGLGGGLVENSTTLLAGQPGAGKTTLTLQVLDGLGKRCLYATGEETLKKVKATGRPSACPSCKSENVFGCESPEDLVEWKLAAQQQRAAEERW